MAEQLKCIFSSNSAGGTTFWHVQRSPRVGTKHAPSILCSKWPYWSPRGRGSAPAWTGPSSHNAASSLWSGPWHRHTSTPRPESTPVPRKQSTDLILFNLLCLVEYSVSITINWISFKIHYCMDLNEGALLTDPQQMVLKARGTFLITHAFKLYQYKQFRKKKKKVFFFFF